MGCSTYLSDRKNKGGAKGPKAPLSRDMAKTWVSKNVTKLEKAFVKAMRLIVQPKGRRNFSRPR